MDNEKTLNPVENSSALVAIQEPRIDERYMKVLMDIYYLNLK